METRITKAGRLDPSFGDGGKVILRPRYGTTHAYDIATGVDDSIFVALTVHNDHAIATGTLFGVAKLHPDGSVDHTFGAEGYAVYPGPGGSVESGTLARLRIPVRTPDATPGPMQEVGIGAGGRQPYILPNGKILLRCTLGAPLSGAPQLPFLVRLNTGGSLDTSFGEAGFRYFMFEEHVLLGATIIPMPDGRIVMAGRRTRADGKTDGVIMRLLEDGKADPSFGNAGILPVGFPGGMDENVHCAVVQGDKFVLGGMTSLQALARRFLPTGEIDATFGVDGSYHLPEIEDPDAGAPWFEQLLSTDSGGFIAVGTDLVPSGHTNLRDFGFVIGIDADGRPNQEFGGGKPVFTPKSLGTSRLKKGMFDQAGRLVVTGSLGGASSKGFLVGRYLAAGVPDELFGDQGFVYILLGEPFEIARGFTLQGSRGILLSGQVVNQASNWPSDAVVMRLQTS
jgi:uncharacterized delta-60 repeat protein